MATARARIRRRQLLAIILVLCVITPIFNVLTNERSLRSALQGLFDGVLIPLLVAGYLMFVRDGALRHWFRRLGFWTDLALSSAIVLALFIVGRAVGQVVIRLDPRRFVESFSDTHLRYALPFFVVVAVTIQFVVQMNRMIGANVLSYMAAGVYRSPKAEERIFLFLDLEGSTQLAERLGSARYFELLRCFVDDLTEPVLESEGEIYQYAGDEVVVTWPIEAGVRAANCVRCFFGIRSALELRSDRYELDFGVVPRFRGGLHGGIVTAGEIGDLKQQIVFVGDILNTAAPGGIREAVEPRPGRLRAVARPARAPAGHPCRAMRRPRDQGQGGPRNRLQSCRKCVIARPDPALVVSRPFRRATT